MLARRLALLACLLGAACVPPSPPNPPGPAQGSEPAPASQPLPARWVRTGGLTTIGPAVPGGTLVLLGGRRALVRADGSVEAERVAAPEALRRLLVVPRKAGGAPALVAAGERGVYRLDDPLGAPVALARSEYDLGYLGSGPGSVAVWPSSPGLPSFLSVETGRPEPSPASGVAALPLRAMAFLDERRGAAIFGGAGLAVTTDAGRTFRVATASAAGEALGLRGLRVRGGSILAFADEDGLEAAVDVDAATIGPPQRPSATPADDPLLRWIASTGRDPIEAVAAEGLDLPGGGALVADHGLLARFDLSPLRARQLLELTPDRSANGCSAARSGATAWMACPIVAPRGEDLFDPFGVVGVRLDPPSLRADPPVLVRNGAADLRASPSGGVMLLGACKGDEVGVACVRQPDGSWKNFDCSLDLTERGAGPLADGSVAFLRGMFDGDSGPAPDAAGQPPSGKLHVATLSPACQERGLRSIPFPLGRGHVVAQSPIEEAHDRSLSFVIEDGEGPSSVVVPPGREAADVQKVPGAALARLRAGHGVAVGADGRVLVSLDAGASWSEAPASPEVSLEAAAAADQPDRLQLGELGFALGSMLRLGWGPPEPAPLSAPLAGALGPPMVGPARERPEPGRVLACKTLGPSPGRLYGHVSEEEILLFDGVGPKMLPGRRVEGTRSYGSRAEVVFREDGPEGRSPSPERWTARWVDPREVGGGVHTWSDRAPAGAQWRQQIGSFAAQGARALLALRSAGSIRLVRLAARGPAEIVEGSAEFLPTGEVAFGASKRAVIAWFHDERLIAWPAGERPRVIGRVSTLVKPEPGEPSDDAVPVFVGASERSLERSFPIPRPVNAGTDSSPPALPPSLDGWRGSAALVLGALPACAPTARGPLFTLVRRSGLAVTLDGVPESGEGTYAVRLDGGEACVAAVSVDLANSTTRPVRSFVRADLVKKRAEGGEKDLRPTATVHRLSCELKPAR